MSSIAERLERPGLPRFAGGAGLAALIMLFLFGLVSPPAMYAGMALVLLALALAAGQVVPVLVRQPLFWLLAVLFAWVFLRGWVDLATAEARDLVPDPGAIWHHARFTPFVPLLFGLWFAAWWRYRHALLLAIAMGALFYYVDHWDRLVTGLPGGEQAFRSAMGEAGMFAATALFVSGGLAASAWFARDELGRVERAVLIAGGLVLTIVSGMALLASMSRAAWLMVLLALVVLAAAGLYLALTRSCPRTRRRLLWALAAGVAGVGVTIALSWELLAARFVRDAETVRVLLTEGYDPDLSGSVAARFRMLLQAGVDIRENPLWGVGPASVRDMLHVIWDQPRGGSGNYHSTYLNLPVAMGLVWTLLWFVAHFWIVGAAMRHLVERHELALAAGIAGAAMAHFGVLVFQVRLWSVQGAALYLAVMAVCCGILLHRYMADGRLPRLRRSADTASAQ